MKISKLIKVAMSSVWNNKTRSFLTMLGIIIGISSVIILVGVGQGTQKTVSDSIEKMGTNLITVNITTRKSYTISDEELKDLATKPGIKQIAPQISQSSVNIKAESKSSTTTLEASTPSYLEVKKLTLSQGRFIAQRDLDNRFNVLVIGPETANTLFSTTNVVGRNMYVNGIEFTIVGVLQAEGNSTTGTSDDKIILPLTSAERLLKTSSVKSYYVQAESKDKVDIATSYIQLFLNKKFGINIAKSTSTTTNSYYRVMSQTSLLETANSTNASMTAMLAGIAAISLVVGGIGIMNIMLVSVIERTREIGTRKAIGAKRRTILLQFLIEAATISSVGGVIGVLIGYIAAYLAPIYFSTTIVISSNVVAASFIFSIMVGIIFGIYPASKASKLNPIEALRFE